MTARTGPTQGRAGRLRLQYRLDTALRGAELLERKLHTLLGRVQVFEQREAAARREWTRLLAEAETRLLRGLLLSGEQALVQATPAARAEVTVEWSTAMGLRHPTGAVCVPAQRSADEPTPRNTALLQSERAYREALRAGAELAAARAAARLISAEANRTRQRVRALRRHWIPLLTQQLAATELALEQAEREDNVRRRWAAQGGGVPGPDGSR
ncbi:V-type ATP synthase subunit D [Streptomyces sp. NPDC059169]|uniref:V-type ATP synthase subunit D n=1 Tax=unclassified Streptomyces TaxID=2593676 RepID=UPI003688DDE0